MSWDTTIEDEDQLLEEYGSFDVIIDELAEEFDEDDVTLDEAGGLVRELSRPRAISRGRRPASP